MGTFNAENFLVLVIVPVISTTNGRRNLFSAIRKISPGVYPELVEGVKMTNSTRTDMVRHLVSYLHPTAKNCIVDTNCP